MSYSSLIDKQLSIAFSKLKDLATDIVFTKTPVSGFDFNTGKVTTGTTSVINAKAVITKEVLGASSEVVEVIAKGVDMKGLTTYDKVSFMGKDWKLSKTIKSGRYVYVFELTRVL